MYQKITRAMIAQATKEFLAKGNTVVILEPQPEPKRYWLHEFQWYPYQPNQ